MSLRHSLKQTKSTSNANLIKRTDDPQIQLCMDDLSAANSQFVIVKDAVDAYTISLSYDGALAIHMKEDIIEQHLTKADTTCCAVSAVASTADVDALLGVIDTMVPSVQDALTSYVAKKPEFDLKFFINTIARVDISDLSELTNHLFDNCLSDFIPPSHTATTHVTVIKSAFADAVAAYVFTG
ncbi:hypothetical protein HPULCUR_008201 [Helicostylum pulchrum]|uniref:Uncharacterized protein n=1 Tax=Helicostylum pulchrum TaxID=562976 RepID=A0ABP9Y6Y1_9FUNG